jgi:hypothetical protein
VAHASVIWQIGVRRARRLGRAIKRVSQGPGSPGEVSYVSKALGSEARLKNDPIVACFAPAWSSRPVIGPMR